MNILKNTHRKRVLIPAGIAAAVLAVGGTTWAATADTNLTGNDLDRASSAALKATGGGKVVDAETSDDAGEAYEVEVRMPNGTERDITLDKKYTVIAQHDDTDDHDGDHDSRDKPDRALGASERASAEEAAAAAVGTGAKVTEVEAEDDGPRGSKAGYEAEVTGSDGTEWDVDLDAQFKVVSKSKDD